MYLIPLQVLPLEKTSQIIKSPTLEEAASPHIFKTLTISHASYVPNIPGISRLIVCQNLCIFGRDWRDVHLPER